MTQAMALLLIDLIDLARLALTSGVETTRRFEAHRDTIKMMIAENREPSDDERQALADDIGTLRRRLHEP